MQVLAFRLIAEAEGMLGARILVALLIAGAMPDAYLVLALYTDPPRLPTALAPMEATVMLVKATPRTLLVRTEGDQQAVELMSPPGAQTCFL